MIITKIICIHICHNIIDNWSFIIIYKDNKSVVREKGTPILGIIIKQFMIVHIYIWLYIVSSCQETERKQRV